MSARALFVTASGTEVGKTLVTAALAHQLRARGESVRVLKPVASGFDPAAPEASDTGLLLAAAGVAPTAEAIAVATPWRFAAPISPDMAAAREGRAIPFDALVAHCRTACAADAAVLIEGIGGVMVPLDATRTVRDLIAALGIPAVLVAGSYLGALSHALSAAEALAARGIPIAGMVVSESETSPVPVAESAACLARFLAPVPVLTVPRLDGPRPWERAPDLTGLVP